MTNWKNVGKKTLKITIIAIFAILFITAIISLCQYSGIGTVFDEFTSNLYSCFVAYSYSTGNEYIGASTLSIILSPMVSFVIALMTEQN